jgi:alpha-glucosidase
VTGLLDEPHHDGSVRYVPAGAPRLGDTLPVRVWVPSVPGRAGRDAQVLLRRTRDGEPAISAARLDASDEAGAWFVADLRLDNHVTSYRFLVDGARDYRWLTARGVFRRDVADAGDFRISVYDPPPDWVADQVVYQVFPDRFARSGADRPTPDWAVPAEWDDPVVHRGRDTPHQWFGGDLDGIAAHLDYVTGLGATMLYLTPIFEARSNHRYDAVTFDRVDPALGGDEAFARLLAAAHARGLRVLGDLTLNHTGVGHEWFRAAVADPDAPEASYYSFRRHPDEYESWLGERSLPKLDHRAAAMRRALYDGPDSVVARWLDFGLDSWRIDVANMTGRLGADDLGHEVARAVRRTMAARHPDAWLLAEHGHDAAFDLLGDGWHGTMDYAGFTRPVWAWLGGGIPSGLPFLGLPVPIPSLPGSAAVATMREVHAGAPWLAWTASTLHLDSHDTPRFRTVAGGGTSGWVDDEGAGRGRHLAGLALQMTLPGVPSVFAGDELGLTAVDGEHARTPFPWKRGAEWDSATCDAYRAWIGLRREHVALRRGGLRWAHLSDDSVTYLREHPDERVLVHVARAAHPPVRLPLAALDILGTVVGGSSAAGAGAAGASGAGAGAAGASVGGVAVLAGDPPRIEADMLVLPSSGPAAHAYRLP